MTQLPPNRQLKKLGEICQIKTGKKDANYGTDDGQYPFFTCGREIIKSPDYSFDTEAILIAGNGDVGACKYYKGKFEAYQRTYVVDDFNKDVSIHYVFHLLNGTLRQHALQESLGSAIPYIKLGVLKNFEIPLPPLPVQHKIVALLDEVSAQITASKSAIQSQLDALDQLWQSSLSEVFENSTIPTKSISEITSLLGDGLHGTPKYDDQGEYYFINGNNLDNGNIVIKDGTKKVSITEYEKYKKNLNDRTILVSINGTIGNVAFYNNEKVVLGKSACYFNLLDNVDKSYVKYAIMSPYFIQYANKELTGTTIKNVSLKTMRAFQIPLPDLATQTHIVSQLDDLSQNIAALRSQYTTQLQHFDDLRASILDQAFKGELVEE